MRLNFIKMHGLGNDFMIVEWPEDRPLPAAEQVIAWGDRRRGVGFDSLLIVEPGGIYRVFNADGGESAQCGNGARCIAAYLAGGEPLELTLRSRAGPVEARVAAGGVVSINLGRPEFQPERVPFRADAGAQAVAADPAAARAAAAGAAAVAAGASRAPDAGEILGYRLDLASGPVEFGIVSMGNPHAVISVDSVADARVGIIAPEMQAHPCFPESVNVGFAEIVSRNAIRLRVYERGVGETLACGTGAAAAMATGRRRGLLDRRVHVDLPGGTLEVDWPGEGHDLWQTGQTTKVYEGLIEI